MDKKKKHFLQNFDFLLLGLVLAATVIGLLCINSATHVAGGVSKDVIVQAVAFVIGLVAMTVVVFVDYSYFDTVKTWIFGVCMAILVLVLFIGIGGTEVGTNGWIRLGPVSVQPSEFAKIGFIITFSAHVAKLENNLNKPLNVLMLCLHFGIYAALVLLQPDWGTAMVFASIFIFILLIAKISWKYIVSALGAFAVAAPILWFFVLTPIQKQRFTVFLNPGSDPLDGGYHVLQSKIAIGSGQILGNGYLQGTQTQMGYLPASRTDFIFAVIGEEFGFVGCVLVLAILVAILIRCIMAAYQAKDAFGQYICIGVAGMLLFHMFENIGMCIGLMPVTGIPLPFVSYGGSSLITNFMAIGLVLNVYLRRKRINF